MNCLSIILASARKLDLADWVLRGLRYKFPSMDATETLITLLALCKAGYRPGSTVMTKDTFIAPVQKTLDAVDYLKPFQLNNLLRVCLDSGIADTKVLRAVLSAILRRLRDYGFDMLNQVVTTVHVHREVVRQTGVLARQQRMPLHAREDGQPDLSQVGVLCLYVAFYVCVCVCVCLCVCCVSVLGRAARAAAAVQPAGGRAGHRAVQHRRAAGRPRRAVNRSPAQVTW